jgi:hypothetical protein
VDVLFIIILIILIYFIIIKPFFIEINKLNLSNKSQKFHYDGIYELKEMTFEDIKNMEVKKHQNTADYNKNLQVIYTSPIPKLDFKSESDYQLYFSNLNRLNIKELYIELSNILAARYHLTAVPGLYLVQTGNNNYERTDAFKAQEIMIELNTKLILVLSKILGDKISNYIKSGNDRKLIEIVDNIDEKLNKNMLPVEYGKEFIKKISKII